jgi:putative transcriptional regulator
MSEKIFSNLEKFRKEEKMTQQALAEEVGVSRQTIIAIEKGNYTPSILLALKISQVLKKPVEEIFYIKNNN